jgi:hypothetical protein
MLPTTDLFCTGWDPVFTQTRDLKEDRSYVEYNGSIDAVDDPLDIFLQDSEYLLDSSKVEVEEFCQGLHLEDLKAGAVAAGARQQRTAWLDDRSFPGVTRSPRVRKHENCLTATGLYRILKEPVWDKP